MSQVKRIVVMEWSVKGHPMQTRTLTTSASEEELLSGLLSRHWHEGDNLPVRVVFYEMRNGQQIKTNHYDSRTRQVV